MRIKTRLLQLAMTYPSFEMAFVFRGDESRLRAFPCLALKGGDSCPKSNIQRTPSALIALDGSSYGSGRAAARFRNNGPD
jgi:hypothetical protein